jgi:hypothetical protein
LAGCSYVLESILVSLIGQVESVGDAIHPFQPLQAY